MPFTNPANWKSLQTIASTSWKQLFARFRNLEELSVSCCQIVDMPPPTDTNAFVRQHGPRVVEEINPPWVEDSNVNMSWVSSLVYRTAPAFVQRLRLSMANIDNVNPGATVNILERLSYPTSINDFQLMHTARLELTLRGIAGVHVGESSVWIGTSFSGSTWCGIISCLPKLQHLKVCDGEHDRGACACG